jgi:hypothetical protein
MRAKLLVLKHARELDELIAKTKKVVAVAVDVVVVHCVGKCVPAEGVLIVLYAVVAARNHGTDHDHCYSAQAYDQPNPGRQIAPTIASPCL